MSNRARTPLLLRMEFTYELEHAARALKELEWSIKRDFWKCAHGKRSIAYVIVTAESSVELVKRLKLDDITSVEDFCCHIAPIGAICKHGGLSTFHDALKKAWDSVGHDRSPAYHQQRQRFNPRTESRSADREYGALRERKKPLRNPLPITN